MKFVAELAAVRGVKLDAGDGIVDQLRQVIRADDLMSKRTRALLAELTRYWGCVYDLVTRQDHSAQREREREPLGPDDARRVVFQTFLVIYEIDRAFAQSRPGVEREA